MRHAQCIIEIELGRATSVAKGAPHCRSVTGAAEQKRASKLLLPDSVVCADEVEHDAKRRGDTSGVEMSQIISLLPVMSVLCLAVTPGPWMTTLEESV